MVQQPQAIHIKGAFDIGNGYTKSFFNIDGRKKYTSIIPSISSKQYNAKAVESEATLKELIEDNQLKSADMAFTSPLVSDSTRRVIGEEATYSAYAEQFDVYAPISKSSVDLSGVLMLGSLAKEALKYAYTQKRLTDESMNDIHVNADITLALPISDHKKHQKAYKERILNNQKPHTVTFYNFGTPVSVHIRIQFVEVINEGESARYALLFARPDFIKIIDEILTSQGIEDISGQDVVAAENVLVMDIGEGTTDFAVFTNSRFNANASNTLNRGYATVLEAALDELNNNGASYSSRKQLSELLYTKKTPLNRSRIDRIEAEVNEQTVQFAQALTDEIGKVFNRVGGFVDVIYVLGGGAGAMKSALEPMIKQHINEFQMSDNFPVIYLEGSYSRLLNVQGLVEVLDKMRK